MVFPSTSLPSFEEKILVTRLWSDWICLFPGSIIVDSLGVCCDANCRSFDRAIKENGGRFSAEFVGGVVAVLRVIPVFLLIILYWAIYSQVIVNIFSSPWLKAHLSSFLIACYPFVACLETLHIFIIFFFRTTRPISTKVGTKHPLIEGFRICSNKGSRLFPRGDNRKIAKIH